MKINPYLLIISLFEIWNWDLIWSGLWITHRENSETLNWICIKQESITTLKLPSIYSSVLLATINSYSKSILSQNAYKENYFIDSHINTHKYLSQSTTIRRSDLIIIYFFMVVTPLLSESSLGYGPLIRKYLGTNYNI